MIPLLILIENDNVADQGVICKGLETGVDIYIVFTFL